MFDILAQNIDCRYKSSEPPRQDGSNVYTQSTFLDQI